MIGKKENGKCLTGLDSEEQFLVNQARQGNLEAYDALVRKYQGKIYALVYNMTSNKEDAEDRVQDIFIKAFRSLRNFRGQSSFYTWLYRIAVNRTINFLKTRKTRPSLSLNEMDSGAEHDPAYVELRSRELPTREVSLQELQKKLNEALQTLSEKHRAVVIMHDIQGLSHGEIAKVLGCSQGTVRSRLFYARRQLQGELKDFAP